MKKSIKFGLGGMLLLLGVTILSGCTASFCSSKDKAHMLYAYDYGVTEYTDTNLGDTKKAYYFEIDNLGAVTKKTLGNVWFSTPEKFAPTIDSINAAAVKAGLNVPSTYYWELMDAFTLGEAIKESGKTPAELTTAGAIRREFKNEEAKRGLLDDFGYLKYYDSAEKPVLWTNWTNFTTQARKILRDEGKVDDAPSTDFTKFYKSKMNSYASSKRSCLATDTGYYGSYGPQGMSIEITGKKWTDWRGLLEFLLVWPIGALIDVLAKGFLHGGVAAGWAQVAAIFVVTMIVRGIMLLATFKQTKSSTKMTELQPEIAKIQAKYPNANTNQYEKQRMAMEMNKLYKKNGVNPLTSLLVMIVQFPVFICVWGAMQGSAILSSGSFLGLRLSDSIGSTITSRTAWANGGGATALVLFLLMAVAQTVAMLLPQWIQKRNQKNVSKLGRNPAQTAQSKRMKWFTYIMLAMIIFMGFSLASGMGVYWFFGAIFSIVQTVITTSIAKKNKKKGNN